MAILHSSNVRRAKLDAVIKDRQDAYARGAPVDAEVAARMTKPKAAEPMHQVFVDVKGEAGSRPASPKFFGPAGQEAAGRIMEALNANICLGRLKGWGNVRIETANHVPNY